jgi:hypothetical protein
VLKAKAKAKAKAENGLFVFESGGIRSGNVGGRGRG